MPSEAPLPPAAGPTVRRTDINALSARASNWVAMSMVVLGVIGYVGMCTYLSRNIVGAPQLPAYVLLKQRSPAQDILLAVHVPDSTFAKHVAAPVPGLLTLEVDADQLMFNRDPVLLVWMTLVSIMVAFSLSCQPLFIAVIGRLINDGLPSAAVRLRVGIALVIGSSLVLLPLLSAHLWSANDVTRLFGIVLGKNGSLVVPVGITILGACTGVTAMLCVGARAAQLGEDYARQRIDAENLELKLKGASRLLRFALSSLAILVTFAVLTSGALRESILGMVQVNGLDVFPIEFVRMYGLFFTVFLAIIYIPMHLQLLSVAELIDTAKDTSTEANDKKSGVLNALPWNEIKTSIAVLLPVISGFLPEQLHHLVG
jgi:hypothetical protein